MTGTQDWDDYALTATVAPHRLGEGGIAVRVCGMRRFYALLMTRDAIQLVKCYDGDALLAEQAFAMEDDRGYELVLQAKGDRLTASVDGAQIFDVRDDALGSGAIGLVSTDGRSAFEGVRVRPL